MVDGEQFVYRANEYTNSLNNATITIKEADKDQSDLLIETLNFKKQIKPHDTEKNPKKKDTLKNLYALCDGRERGREKEREREREREKERVLDAFEAKIFQTKTGGKKSELGPI